MPGAKPEPIWNDIQLGLTDGTAPEMLRDGRTHKVAAKAAEEAKGRLNHYLDMTPVLPESNYSAPVTVQ